MYKKIMVLVLSLSVALSACNKSPVSVTLPNNGCNQAACTSGTNNHGSVIVNGVELVK